VQTAHAAGLKIILDWVPAHFPTDEHACWPVSTARRSMNMPTRAKVSTTTGTPSSTTSSRHEVRNFLVGNALFWVEQYGIDALRVDAVASMLYRDYSRPADEWVPNQHWAAARTWRRLPSCARCTRCCTSEAPACASTMAEESTAFPARDRSGG
jgi:1,4-alpha-glucan branching enzyme